MCEIAFSWWCVIQFRRLVLLIFLKISGKQMAVYHSEFAVLRCCSGMVKTCSVFWKNRPLFAWICFAREQFLLISAHWKTPIQSTAYFLWVHTRKSTIYYLSRCYKRVLKHRYRNILTFFSIIQDDFYFDKLCGIQHEQMFFQSNARQ